MADLSREGEGEYEAEQAAMASEKLHVDGILHKWVGDFGPAQWIHFSISSLAWALEALHTLVMIFADRKPQWRRSLEDPSISMCSTDRSLWEWADGRGASTVSDFGLVCGNEYRVGLVQSMFFVGALVGAGMFGSLADSFLGRKGALRVACLSSGLLGMATALSPNYWLYLVLRMLTGITSVGGIGLSSFVLATEPIGQAWRGAVGMSTLYFFSLGTVTLVGFARLFPSSWRSLYVFTSLPTLVYCICLLPLVHESPRWLVVQGRRDDAMHVLRAFARKNSRSVPESVSLASESSCCSAEEGDKASGTIADVFRNPRLRLRMLLMICIWFSCSVAYYGVSLNVTNTGFNLYASVLLNALVELPAVAITAWLLGKLGRRAMLVASMSLSGIFCSIGSVLYAARTGGGDGELRSVAGLVCGAVAIFGMAGAYNLVYIYTSELFPTVVRNAALGVATQAGQVGAIAAPLIVQLAGVHQAAPFGVFASAGLAGGLLGLKLPETLNHPLFDTLEGIAEAGDKRPELDPLLLSNKQLDESV